MKKSRLRIFRKSAIGPLFGLLICLAMAPGIAYGGPLVGCDFAPDDKNGCLLGSTGWMASWESDDIKLAFVDNVVGSNKGFLTKMVTFNSMNPLTIKFDQVTFNPNPGNSLGLRFTMFESISNKSTFDWSG